MSSCRSRNDGRRWPGSRPAAASRAGRRTAAGAARGGRSGLPWILPAFVFVVGLIYYCIGYTGYISTLNWDGVSPNPQHVGLRELHPGLP